MRGFAAAFILLVSCEPFPGEAGGEMGDSRDAFEYWRGLVVDGRFSECVQMMTQSYKSQWLYDVLTKGDFSAGQWRAKLTGPARTDLDLWFSEAGKDASAGRVLMLPRSVLAEPSLNPLLASYLVAERAELADQFRRLQIVKVSADEYGVTVLVHNRRGDPELYQLVVESGGWKVDGHTLRGAR
jgi:hypothetical protein